jgi:small subunit ribosomal protein S16
MTTPATVSIDLERAKYWISCGAQPTDTVRGLLKLAEANAQQAE